MLQQVAMFCVNSLFAALTPDKVREFILTGIAKVERYVDSTETDYDDQIVDPAINLVMAALQISQKDGVIDVDSELKKLFKALGDLTSMFIDAGLDYIEDAVQNSENKLDDIVVLPLCQLIRTILDVPDAD